MRTKDDPNYEDQLTEVARRFIAILLEKIETAPPEADKVKKLPDKLMTGKEVCYYFQISKSTLERRIREGLKYKQAVRKGNRLFSLSDCEKFFNIKYNKS